MERYILVNVYSIGGGDSKAYRIDAYSDKHRLIKLYINENEVKKFQEKLFTEITEFIDFYYDNEGVPHYFVKR